MEKNSSRNNKEMHLEARRENQKCPEKAMFRKWSKWRRRSWATGVTESSYFWNNEAELQISGGDEEEQPTLWRHIFSPQGRHHHQT